MPEWLVTAALLDHTVNDCPPVVPVVPIVPAAPVVEQAVADGGAR